MTGSALRSTALIVATVIFAACGSADSGSAVATGSALITTDSSANVRQNCCSPSDASASAIMHWATGDSRGTVRSGEPIKAVIDLPAGLAGGGTTLKSASGYADTLLTGRWAVRDTRPCKAVTARICGPS